MRTNDEVPMRALEGCPPGIRARARVAGGAVAALLATASLLHATGPLAPGRGWAEKVGEIEINTSAVGPDRALAAETYLSGDLWGPGTGWVHLGSGPLDGARYAQDSAADFGVNVEPDGRLTGFAWAEKTGWIEFPADGPGAALAPGDALSQVAWSRAGGWITWCVEPCRATVRLEPSGPGNVDVVLAHAFPLQGGQFGIGYDDALGEPRCIFKGPALAPFISAELFSSYDAPNQCEGAAAPPRGMTIGWLTNFFAKELLEPGEHILFTIHFEPVEAPVDLPLAFVSCLGPRSGPIENVVTDAKGDSQPLRTVDGLVALGSRRFGFTRGDANADGSHDISDALTIFGYLFLGKSTPTCLDAADGNDDGGVDITDGIFLLQFKFLGGPPPPAPFPGCGPDETPDDLRCTDFPPCDPCLGGAGP